jgi:hypothetical protein
VLKSDSTERTVNDKFIMILNATLEDQDPYLELKQPFKWRESKAGQMPR